MTTPTKFAYPVPFNAGISDCWSQLLRVREGSGAGWVAGHNPDVDQRQYGMTRLQKGRTVVDVLFAPGRRMHTTEAFAITSAVGNSAVKREIGAILAEVRTAAEFDSTGVNERDPRPQMLEADAQNARAGARTWDEWGQLESSQLG